MLLNLVAIIIILSSCAKGDIPKYKGRWIDHATTEFAKGSGTESDPYQISKPEELAKLSFDLSPLGSVTDGYKNTYFLLTFFLIFVGKFCSSLFFYCVYHNYIKFFFTF